MDEPDLRAEELATIEAIYQDLAAVDLETFSGTVHVPIVLDGEVSVKLSALQESVISTSVSYLPSVDLCFWLPEKYPYEEPPRFELQSPILEKTVLSGISSELVTLWNDLKDQVLFTMVDFLQQKTEEYANIIGSEYIKCNGDQALYQQLIVHDEEKRKFSFENASFTCEICQRHLKGDKCVKFCECGHVFCRDCLRDFFASLIDSGDVEKVHCPDFECGKQALSARENYLRLDTITQENFDFDQFRQKIMKPPIKLDILQMVLGTDSTGVALYERYMSIYTDHQHALIAKLFPLRLVSCPRKNCPSMIFRENTQERLVVCRKCDYAFCNTCRKSYHSSSIDCTRSKTEAVYQTVAIEDIEIWIAEGKSTPRGNELRCKYGLELLRKVADEYTMDQLFNEMLKENSYDFSKCPTCDIVIQRLEGCNKMRCTHCYTFFCHMCSAFLDPDHPYDHFKDRASPCYNRLFHGMPGTEDLD